MPETTIEDLKKMRSECLIESEIAIMKFPGHYAEMKNLIKHILMNKIDIDEYYELACHLAELIKKMGLCTIFYQYFYENIHPHQKGTPRYFRTVCGDLSLQIDELTRWRTQKRKLKVVE